jgi:hypothetical protein
VRSGDPSELVSRRLRRGRMLWFAIRCTSEGSSAFLERPSRSGLGEVFLPAGVIAGVIVWRLLVEEKYLDRNLLGNEEYRWKVRWRLGCGD